MIFELAFPKSMGIVMDSWTDIRKGQRLVKWHSIVVQGIFVLKKVMNFFKGITSSLCAFSEKNL